MARTTIGRLLERRTTLENPAVPLTDVSLAEWLGGQRTLSGVTVSEERALGLTAFYRAVNLIASTAASLPLKVYRTGTHQEITNQAVINKPHPDLTPFELWEIAYVHVLTWGNAYLRKIRGGAGQVVELWPIHPRSVRVDLVDPTEESPGGKVFVVADGKTGRGVPYTNHEILHIPGPGYDGRVGVSPVRLMRQPFGSFLAAEEYAARFFGQGALQSGMVIHDKVLTEESARKLKTSWREKNQGIAQAHDVMILDGGAKFQSLSIHPHDAQLLETRRWSATEIARLFGIPPHLLGDVDKSTSWGTGIEQQTTGFVVFTMRAWLTRFEQRISRECLVAPYHCAYDVQGLLRGDQAARSAFYASGIQNKWMVPDEARAAEGMEPLPDGLGAKPVDVAPIKDPSGLAAPTGGSNADQTTAA